MDILPKRPTEKGPSERFVGDVWLDTIVRGAAPSRIRSAVVRFAPGARNAWHRHAVGQTLYVTEGVGRTQARDGKLLEIRPGDVILTAPGEWHWHGAAPDRFMTHITIYEEPADGGPESEWGEAVGDEAYLATPANADRG
jgi:quercetin dioxygenase-like cupin family protein